MTYNETHWEHISAKRWKRIPTNQQQHYELLILCIYSSSFFCARALSCLCSRSLSLSLLCSAVTFFALDAFVFRVRIAMHFQYLAVTFVFHFIGFICFCSWIIIILDVWVFSTVLTILFLPALHWIDFCRYAFDSLKRCVRLVYAGHEIEHYWTTRHCVCNCCAIFYLLYLLFDSLLNSIIMKAMSCLFESCILGNNSTSQKW